MSDPRYLQEGRDAQAAHVVEEFGEVCKDVGDLIAAIGKTKRWGWNSVNPELESDRETNRDWVRRAIGGAYSEIYDLLEAIKRLENTLDAEED